MGGPVPPKREFPASREGPAMHRAQANVLVIGAGSIGQRHARLLQQREDCRVEVYSRRSSSETLEQVLQRLQPHFVVVCNETAAHFPTLMRLEATLEQAIILIEKPLFEQLHPLPPLRHPVYVAYNLRFHPLLQALHHSLQGQKIVSLQVMCSSFLPDWRPQSDYRLSYSAHKDQGGGVLRDVSHEIDYALWLAGPWKKLVCVQEQLSALEISSDDTLDLLAQLHNGAQLNLHLDYTCRQPLRRGVIQTDQACYVLDLIQGSLSGPEGQQSCQLERDFTYQREHQDLLGERRWLCTLQQALEVQSLMAAAEQSALEQRWVAAP